uniref:BTB domain-containing protein n=1 Tax=Corethrella appendiculata TaxID=1370023 RepID=U5ETV2_9DIPT
MGNIVNKIKGLDNVSHALRGRKRKHTDSDYESCDELTDQMDRSLNTPKRKKLVSTAKYIYQALFKEEHNSDISVAAMGKVWHLHKIYLSQSPYFASMFSGSWKETLEDYIDIKIVDTNINVESLNAVFGSLYMDEVVLEPKEIVSILATATLFQLDNLIEQCADVMIETTNPETAVRYYEASKEYGVKKVKESTFNWLLVNLLSFYLKNTKWLRLIDTNLMHSLVSSPELFVMQTEFTLYTLLRYWLFLKTNPNYIVTDKSSSMTDQVTKFFDRDDNTPFLQTRDGQPYEKVFRVLRIQHLLNHHVDLKVLQQDNIIPKNWINELLFHSWSNMLKVDQTLESGPKECDEKVFLDSCMRCGRTLLEATNQKWRWTGFNFGLDLVLISDTKSLRIKRHHRTENERLLSLQLKRNFLIRVQLASLDDLRQIKHKQSTEIQSISLEKNAESILMVFDKKLTYPMLLSVNLMVINPNTSPANSKGTESTSNDAGIPSTSAEHNSDDNYFDFYDFSAV